MSKKVVFSPYSSRTNKYVNIIVESIRCNGIEVISMREFLFSYKNFISIKTIHLNWFEDLIGENFFSRSFDFFRKILLLILFKVFRKRVVWTMHNRESHKSGLSFLRNVLRNIILSCSSVIVIHSEETRKILNTKNLKHKNKIVYIPHPNYIDIYGSCFSDVSSYRVNNHILRLLFIGAVKPYKNIELLIELARSLPTSIEIVIAGNPSSSEYKEQLYEMSDGIINVRLYFEFIPDNKIPELISSCDLMIFPLDLKSSLNSGSVMLAFSYCKSVICPNIGTVKDIEENKSMFIYDYKNDSEHFDKLSMKIHEVILLKQKDANLLGVCGSKMYSYVALHNSKENVGKKYKNFIFDFL